MLKLTRSGSFIMRLGKQEGKSINNNRVQKFTLVGMRSAPERAE